MYKEIPYTLFGARIKMHVALDTTQGPEILVFKVASGAPAVDFDGDGIFAASGHCCDVEFRRGFTALGITNKLAIDPKVKCRADRAKAYKQFASFPISGYVEIPFVRTHRVLVMGHVGFIDIKRVGDIDINRITESVSFPVGWHRNAGPVRDVIIILIKICRAF